MESNYFLHTHSVDKDSSTEFLNKYISKFSDESIGFLGLEEKYLFKVSHYIQKSDFLLNSPMNHPFGNGNGQSIPILIFTKIKEKVLENRLNKLTKKYRLLERIEFNLKSLVKKEEKTDLVKSHPLVPSTEIFIRERGWLKKILINQINWIKLDGVYTHLHCENHVYTLRSTSKEVLSKLPCSDFIQIHKCYYVNLRKVEALNCESIRIGEEILPIGRTYHKELIHHINQIGG